MIFKTIEEVTAMTRDEMCEYYFDLSFDQNYVDTKSEEWNIYSEEMNKVKAVIGDDNYLFNIYHE